MLGVLGKDICTISWYAPKFKVSAVQSRGPRPQCFAVLNEKNQNWYSQVDIVLLLY